MDNDRPLSPPEQPTVDELIEILNNEILRRKDQIAELKAALCEADRILAARQEPDATGDISIVRERIRSVFER